ncbi:MAG: hypothetical protein AB7P34_09350 [Vicinamibacterales bacterium]
MPVLLMLALAAGLATQGGRDPLLSQLAGKWSGSGTVLNQPANIEMEWTWELGGQFLKLTFANAMPSTRSARAGQGAAGEVTTFEGHAYYRAVGDGRYRGMWFDNSGMFRPLDARREGDALVSLWGTADTEQGETTYRLMPGGGMEVVDRVKGKDGTWRTFGQSGLMKR